MENALDYLNQIFQSDEITWETALVRFLFSFILGALVGLERETHNQPAGLRTHILISIGSTMIMLISIYIPQIFPNSDPARMAAQVVSGIGFLGAGAILKYGVDIKGLTTAASIWVIAAVGLAVGAGMYLVSIIGVVIILFALTIMNIFEKRIFKERSLRKIELILKKQYSEHNSFIEVFEKFDVKINSSGFDRNVQESTDKFTFLVAVTLEMNVQQLADSLEQQPGIVSVSVDIIQ